MTAERALAPLPLGERSVAVMPFAVASADTLIAPLGFGLADLLMADLGRSHQLELVERLRMDAISQELKLASTGRVDSATAPRTGHLAGARHLVVGSLAQRGTGTLIVDARIADVATAQVRPAVLAQAPLAQILDAEKQLALQLIDELGVTLTPAERAAIEERPTKNLSALLAYSRGVRDEADGRSDDAIREYRQAISLDPAFTRARGRLTFVTANAAAIGGHRGQSAATTSLARVQNATINEVNALALPPATAAATAASVDPSYPGQSTTTVVVHINTP